jgi:hypothetical protein
MAFLLQSLAADFPFSCLNSQHLLGVWLASGGIIGRAYEHSVDQVYQLIAYSFRGHLVTSIGLFDNHDNVLSFFVQIWQVEGFNYSADWQ